MPTQWAQNHTPEAPRNKMELIFALARSIIGGSRQISTEVSQPARHKPIRAFAWRGTVKNIAWPHRMSLIHWKPRSGELPLRRGVPGVPPRSPLHVFHDFFVNLSSREVSDAD
jgi:hypothetical protein